MPAPERALSLSERGVAGLLALHRYRLLSVEQFSRAADLKVSHVRDLLRDWERKGALGSIGNVGLRGGAKAPKLYFLTASGHAALLDASGFEEAALGPHQKPHTNTRWSPVMAHRMATIDLLLAVEAGLRGQDAYRLVRTFHEYRRVKAGDEPARPETSDLVDPGRGMARIVPDAAFVLENRETGRRALFFLETDRGTERVARFTEGAYSLLDKFALYERYLEGGRFAATYAGAGAFRFFNLLFVTSSAARIATIREEARGLREDLHPYFKLAVFPEAREHFLGRIWWSRDVREPARSGLVKGFVPKSETNP